jgi:hypothetical protein
MLLLNYRVHQATVQRHVKMNQEEIQIKPSNIYTSVDPVWLGKYMGILTRQVF